jgi:SAM-dependent methyltransferase
MSDKLLTEYFPLRPALPLPAGRDEDQIHAELRRVQIAGAPQEIVNYCDQDWRRFLYTYGLAEGLTGRALEIGANPYFTTYLLKTFTPLELTLTNYFDSHFNETAQLVAMPHDDGAVKELTLKFDHFDVESSRFPYPDQSFDVVFFCEVMEHMTNDPLSALREINRVLRPGGTLILTTPNVARLENVARLVAGANIYDPYSGYGPHGRHNREFIMHELFLMLQWCGFDFDRQFTADVHDNLSLNYMGQSQLEQLCPILNFRRLDLGQYLFTRSVKKRAPRLNRPNWLYRSYPLGELVEQ